MGSHISTITNKKNIITSHRLQINFTKKLNAIKNTIKLKNKQIIKFLNFYF